MLNLRAHHILCLLIPEADEFRSIAKEIFRKFGYDNNYANAYMQVFEFARSNEDETIKILDSPRGDDTCSQCGNNKEGVCSSLHAATFTKWDKEILGILGLNAGNIVKISDLRKLIKENIPPENMPGVCKECLFGLNGKCREILVKMRGRQY